MWEGALTGPKAAAVPKAALLVLQAGSSAGLQVQLQVWRSLHVQDLCRAIPDTPVPVHSQTIPKPCCTQLGVSCPSVPALHCQMPGGAMRTLGGCDLQSDRGLQERGTAAGQTQLRFPPWFSVHLGNCVQEKAKGNQFLCMLFPLKIKMWFCTKHWEAKWDRFWALTSWCKIILD